MDFQIVERHYRTCDLIFKTTYDKFSCRYMDADYLGEVDDRRYAIGDMFFLLEASQRAWFE